MCEPSMTFIGKICFKTKNVDSGKRTNGSERERFEIQTFIKLNSIMKKLGNSNEKIYIINI
jgi:hypothetical protein